MQGAFVDRTPVVPLSWCSPQPLDADQRNQAGLAVRFQHPRIRPLEIWDLQVGEQTLWEGMEDPRFGVMLARALEDLRRGTASSRSDGRLPAVPFEALHFTGGRLKNPEHTADWTFPWLHSLDAEPVYPAVAQHFMDPVIMDVGQTAIKLYRGSAQTLNVPLYTGPGTLIPCSSRCPVRSPRTALWVAVPIRA